MSQERFDQFEELKKQAAEALRLPSDHQKVILLAGLKLEHTRQLERLVAGHSVNPADLLAVSEAISKLSPELPPPEVKVTFVEGVVGIFNCQHCGKRNELEDGTYTPPSKAEPKLGRTIEGEIVKHADATPTQSDAKPAPKAEAKPEKLFEPSRDFHAGAPLRNGNEPWRAHVRGNG
jgi:hypothetical protein